MPSKLSIDDECIIENFGQLFKLKKYKEIIDKSSMEIDGLHNFEYYKRYLYDQKDVKCNKRLL